MLFLQGILCHVRGIHKNVQFWWRIPSSNVTFVVLRLLMCILLQFFWGVVDHYRATKRTYRMILTAEYLQHVLNQCLFICYCRYFEEHYSLISGSLQEASGQREASCVGFFFFFFSYLWNFIGYRTIPVWCKEGYAVKSFKAYHGSVWCL